MNVVFCGNSLNYAIWSSKDYLDSKKDLLIYSKTVLLIIFFFVKFCVSLQPKMG